MIPRLAATAPFYGWRIVAAIFVMLAVSSGLGFYSMAVFLEALTTQQDFSVSAVSGATALLFVVSGISGVFIAGLIRRYDPRLPIAVGALIASIALVLIGRAQELWQIYADYTLFGVGQAASSLVPGTTLLTRWFVRRRAVAISLASTGLSVGGVVLTPLAAAGIQKYGMEVTTLWMAIAYLVGIVPVTAVVLRPYPATLGLLPDGDRASGLEESFESSGTRLRHALSSRFYVAMTVGFAFVMAAQVGGIAHQFKLVATRVDATFAAIAVSALAATSIVGRLTGGWLVTVISMRGFTVAMTLLQAVALVVLGLSQTPAALLAGTLVFGVTMGNLLMLQPLLLAEAFGVRDYSRIYAISYLVSTVGLAAGPWVMGLLHDAAGGYTEAFLVGGLVSIVATVCLLAAGPLAAARGAESAPAARPVAQGIGAEHDT